MNEVYSFLEENLNLEENQYIVVGVSGGADSMALLHILMEYCKNSNCQIVCVHIHHNLRKESDEEQFFVKQYCEENHLLFETTKFYYDTKFTEKIGREKRYQFFEEILKKYHSSYLLTAHHGDDLVETILMRLSRGSSLKGMCGIEKVSKRAFYRILRPLLYLDKTLIYQYVKEKHIPYVEDNSNQDSHYTRNRYRKEILPFLKRENPNIHLKFLEYSEELKEATEYIEKKTTKAYLEIVKEGKLQYELFQKLEILIQKEVLKKYLFSIYEKEIDKITKKHLCILMDFIHHGEINSSIHFPLQYLVKKDYQFIFFDKFQTVENYFLPLEDITILPNSHKIEKILESNETSNFVTYLDSSMLQFPLSVRNYQIGDKMTIKNMTGHKKVGDIFTNEKVSLEERKIWPVVIDSTGTIIWLPGLKKTQFDRKKNGIYDIILKYY